MSRLAAVLERSVGALDRAGVPTPRVDAELLIGHVLGLSRGGVQARSAVDAEVGAADEATIDELVARRAAREPLQHITGRAPFRALDLAVGPGVFVPRPETEEVAGIAIEVLRAVASPNPVAVDLGTGSGAIALAMATEVPHATVVGVELDPDALAWAQRNLTEIGAANVQLLQDDLATALPELNGTADLVISNPPYIPVGMVPRDPEVRLHDPEVALYGGPDGLDAVRQVSQTALRLLRPGGTLVIEHGELQAAQIAALLRSDGWSAIAHHRDALGRDRATTALRPGP